VINSNSTLTWYLSKMRPYWIPVLRYDLRMGKPLRYHSPPHLLQQLRRKRKESTWNLLSTWSTQCSRQIQIHPTTRKRVLKLIPSSQSLLRHFMSPKLQFFNVSKSHLLLKASRINAHKVTNLGTIILRRSFEASKLAT
jgi:hypothetical protein